MRNSLEEDLFRRRKANPEQLESFGFQKQEDGRYFFSKTLSDSGMRCEITTDLESIQGKVIDPFLEEEYIAFRVGKNIGAYAAGIRREYLELLEEIAEACFYDVPFVTHQGNLICDYLKTTYGLDAEHVFKKQPEDAIYKVRGKWFAAILHVDRAKLDGNEGEVEILNLKSQKKAEEFAHPSIFPAWHMNKDSWITLVLDGSLDDSFVLEALITSYKLIGGEGTLIRREWIIPANPSYFDLDHGFAQSKTLYWKQSSKVHVGDRIYIYYGMPYGELRYLCTAVETDIPFEGVDDGPVHMEILMRIHLDQMFEGHHLDRKKLKQFGITNIRGPRYMTKELKEEIRRIYGTINGDNQNEK